MGHGESRCLVNLRMAHKSLFDLSCGNLLSAPVDEFLETARNDQVPLRVKISLIPGSEPATGEGALVLQRIVVIARGDIHPANHDLAGPTRAQKVTGLIHNVHLRTGSQTNRTRLTPARRERGAGHLVGGLWPP